MRSITHRNCWSIFFCLKKRVRIYVGVCMCSLFYVYMNAVTIHSISFFFLCLLGGHHNHIIQVVVMVVAIRSSFSYSYSSSNQLRVVGAIFPPIFSLYSLSSFFWFYYLPEKLKKKRENVNKRKCTNVNGDGWSIEYPFQIISSVYVW